MKPKAQASIEAMLAIAAMLSAAAIIMPAGINAKNSLELELEKKKALSFLEEIGQKSCSLTFFAEHTTASAKAFASREWKISLGKEKGAIEIAGGADSEWIEVEKKLECGTKNFFAQKTGAIRITLERQSDGILARD